MSDDEKTGSEQDFWSQRKEALDSKLDGALTAQREAFGGGRRKLTYLEGHTAIAQLNRLFGYGSWSYSIDQMGVDEYTQGPQEQWYAGFWAVVTLRVGGVSRQDVGCVEVQNTGKGGSVRDNVHNVDSRSTARKGAVTDALKRAARTFGQQLGNGLYDPDDDVYAWMTLHSLEEPDAGGATPQPPQAGGHKVMKPSSLASSTKAPASAPRAPAGVALKKAGVTSGQQQSAADWTRAQLRGAIEGLEGRRLSRVEWWQQLARDYACGVPASANDMTQPWLLCLYQAMQAQRTHAAITRADDFAALSTVMTDAIGLRDRREISSAQYTALDEQAQARYARLAAPAGIAGSEEEAQDDGAPPEGEPTAEEYTKDLARRLRSARSEREIGAALELAQTAKDAGLISQEQRVDLLRKAETRRAALSGPLTAQVG